MDANGSFALPVAIVRGQLGEPGSADEYKRHCYACPLDGIPNACRRSRARFRRAVRLPPAQRALGGRSPHGQSLRAT